MKNSLIKFITNVVIQVPILRDFFNRRKPKSSVKDITSAILSDGIISVEMDIKGDIISGLFPKMVDRKDLHVSVQAKGTVDMPNGQYRVMAEDGSTRTYSLQIGLLNGIPVLELNPSAGVNDRETYVPTAWKLDDQLSTVSGNTNIRGRGNSSWGYKLPTGQFRNSYKIKFDDRVSLFGFPADKEWAILANVYDKSLLRNVAYFWLSEQVRGKEWTPRHCHLDVFLWGEYAGNYLLVETIKTGKDRVNIDTKNGGWTVEFNSKPEEEGTPRFTIGAGGNWMPVDLKEGKDAERARTDIQTWYDGIEHYKFAGYDVKSFASGFIVNEVFANNDAGFFSSVYLTKANATAPIQYGPVWDADLSSGNVGPNVNPNAQINPEGWGLFHANIWQFVKNDPAFISALKETWNTNRAAITALPAHIGEQANRIELSANATFKTFDIMQHLLVNTYQLHGSWRGEVEYLQAWLSARIEWMDTEIQKL